MIRVAVVGFGHWGPNLARNLALPGRAEVAVLCDHDLGRLAPAMGLHPRARSTRDALEAVTAPDVDAVVVATPAHSHFEIALAALEAGKHVLICKPMTRTSDEALRLIAAAERRGRVLMVDHTFVHTGAVQAMAEIVRRGDLGEVRSYDSTRSNLGLFRADANVLWDLAIHDLAILDHVLDARPLAVSATGVRQVSGFPESTAFLTLFLPGDAIAHVNVSWLSPTKQRRVVLGGERGMLVYDDTEPVETLCLHDVGFALEAAGGVTYRRGGTTTVAVDPREALASEAEHFLACIETGAAPVTGGAMALRLTRVLEAADVSMRDCGRPVEVVGD